jgi:hypothetical protein
MPAKSVAQRRFMGMVRATQKGEMKNPSPELKRAAGDMSVKAVKKFAKTKEKNLPDTVHKMPDGTLMPGKTHKEAYAVQAMTVVPGGADHSNTRQGSIGKKKKKEDIKEFVGAAAAGTAGALTAKKGNRVKKAVGSGAGYAVGSTVGRKVGGAVGQAVGQGTVPLVGGAIGKQVGKAIGHGVGGAAGAIAGGKLATKIGKKKEKKETNEEMQLEKFSAITKKRINKMAADKKVGKGEKIGSVVGGIGGALALGAVDGPLPVGDVVGGVVGSKIGGKIGKQFDKKKVKKEEYMDEAKYEAGASTYGKASIRNKRKFGTKGENPDPLTGKKITKDATRGELIAKRREEHKAKRGVKKEEIDRPYTGPDKKDRAVIKKMDNKKFAAKLADYEKNMDPKKRQALKDKATKGMKFVHEEGAPTMNTGSNASAAGFSSDADENGPTAGMDQPLGGTAKLKGKGPKLTKKKAKCKKSPDGINKICESTEARYLSFLVQMDDVEFIFQGKSPADVKIRLRKIYRPERLKGIKITRMLPAQVMHYYWEKRQAAM